MARVFMIVALLGLAQARLWTPKTAPSDSGLLGLEQLDTDGSAGQRPMFTEKTMPKVSPALQCVMGLSMQYFIIYMVLAFRRKSSARPSGKKVTCRTVAGPEEDVRRVAPAAETQPRKKEVEIMELAVILIRGWPQARNQTTTTTTTTTTTYVLAVVI